MLIPLILMNMMWKEWLIGTDVHLESRMNWLYFIVKDQGHSMWFLVNAIFQERLEVIWPTIHPGHLFHSYNHDSLQKCHTLIMIVGHPGEVSWRLNHGNWTFSNFAPLWLSDELIRLWCSKVQIRVTPRMCILVNVISKEHCEGISSLLTCLLGLKDEKIRFWWSKVTVTVT